jgi:hypothetical protein
LGAGAGFWAIACHLMTAHKGLETWDMLSFLIAVNADNRVIEPEALAGCDTIQALTNLVKSLAAMIRCTALRKKYQN